MSRKLHPLLACLGVAYVAYAALSITFLTGDWQGPSLYLASLVAAFAVGLWIEKPVVVWMGACFCASALAGVLLLLWMFFGASPINANVLGCIYAVCLIASVAYGAAWFYPIFGTALLLTDSRGAILSAGAVIALYFFRRRYNARPLIAASIFLGVSAYAYIAKPDLVSAIYTRLGIWQDTTNNLTLFGHGFGSFELSYLTFAVKTNFGFLIAQHTYNDFLEQVFCLGFGSIPLFLLIAAAFDYATEERMILGCFILLGLTFFPFWVFPLGHLFAFTLAYQLKGVHYGSLATRSPALS